MVRERDQQLCALDHNEHGFNSEHLTTEDPFKDAKGDSVCRLSSAKGNAVQEVEANVCVKD